MAKPLLWKKTVSPPTVHSRKLCTFLGDFPHSRTSATRLSRKCNQYVTGKMCLLLSHLIFLIVSPVFSSWAISQTLLNHLQTRKKYWENTSNREATVPSLCSPIEDCSRPRCLLYPSLMVFSDACWKQKWRYFRRVWGLTVPILPTCLLQRAGVHHKSLCTHLEARTEEWKSCHLGVSSEPLSGKALLPPVFIHSITNKLSGVNFASFFFLIQASPFPLYVRSFHS